MYIFFRKSVDWNQRRTHAHGVAFRYVIEFSSAVPESTGAIDRVRSDFRPGRGGRGRRAGWGAGSRSFVVFIATERATGFRQRRNPRILRVAMRFLGKERRSSLTRGPVRSRTALMSRRGPATINRRHSASCMANCSSTPLSVSRRATWLASTLRCNRRPA